MDLYIQFSNTSSFRSYVGTKLTSPIEYMKINESSSVDFLKKIKYSSKNKYSLDFMFKFLVKNYLLYVIYSLQNL